MTRTFKIIFSFFLLAGCTVITQRPELDPPNPAMTTKEVDNQTPEQPTVVFAPVTCEQVIENVPTELTAVRKLRYADCVFKRGEVQNALDNYNWVYDSFKLSSPKLRTDALLGKSKVSERKGDWTKSILLLKEAEPFIQQNGTQIESTTLAIRLGFLYTYTGNKDVGLEYIKKAEDSFQKLPSGDDKTEIATVVSDFYNDYLMPQDFNDSLEVFRRAQSYMIYVLLNGNESQRKDALQRFIDAELNYYQLVQKENDIQTAFKPADNYELQLIRRQMLQKIYEVSHEASVLLGAGALLTPEPRKLREFLRDFMNYVDADIAKIRRDNPLTPESSILHSIKRPGTIVPNELLKEEQK